jgi:WD40 repeat protein
VASSAEDGTMRLWDTATGLELFPRTRLPPAVDNPAVSPDGKTIATTGADIRLWDARTGQERQALILHRGGVVTAVFSADGRTLASGGDDTVRLWDPDTGDERRSFGGHEGGVNKLAFSPDGRLLAAAVGGDQGSFHTNLWDLNAGKLRHTLTGHNFTVRSVAFSPVGSLLATCGGKAGGKTILLFDPISGRTLGDLDGHGGTGEVSEVVFRPDGKVLASAGFDGTVRLWDVVTRKELHTLRGHNDLVVGLAFTPDSKWLASAGDDGNVRLWNAETGAAGKVYRICSSAGHLGRLTFSPEGRHLLVTGDNGVVYILRLWPPVTGH